MAVFKPFLTVNKKKLLQNERLSWQTATKIGIIHAIHILMHFVFLLSCLVLLIL